MAAIPDEHVDTKIRILDTGCSNHMTGQKVWLSYFDESKKSKVKLANNSLLQAEGIGDIVIQRNNNAKYMIKDILYVLMCWKIGRNFFISGYERWSFRTI